MTERHIALACDKALIDTLRAIGMLPKINWQEVAQSAARQWWVAR